MTDPFVSPWIYAAILFLCFGRGRRTGLAALVSASIAYGVSFVLQRHVILPGHPAGHFPSISVAIMGCLGYWALSGTENRVYRISAYLGFLTTVITHRLWSGFHTPIDVLGALFLSALCIFLSSRLTGYWNLDSSSPVSVDSGGASWPLRAYIPPAYYDQEWTRAEIADRYPDAVTPLFSDLFLSAVGRAVHKATRILGIKKPSSLIGYSVKRGYAFANMGFKVLSVPALALCFWNIRRNCLKYLRSGYPDAVDRFWVRYTQLDQQLSRSNLSLSQLYCLAHDSRALFEEWMSHHTASLLYVTFGLHYVRLMVFLHFPRSHQEIIAALPLGLPTTSHEESEVLYRLGKLLPTHDVSMEELSTEARDVAEQALRLMGDRASSYDFTYPLWRETPELIFQMARAAGDSPESPGRQLSQLAEQRADAERRLTTRVKGLHWFSGARFGNELLELTTGLYPLKESRQRQMASAWALVKRATRRLGGVLVEQGVMDRPENIYFLTAQELSSLIHRATNGRSFGQPFSTAQEVAAHVLVRERLLRLAGAEGPPESARVNVFELPALRETPTQDAKGGVLSAKYSLPGQADGPVVIIRRENEFGKMRAGMILVAPVTNPNWDSLFWMARGVVVERGGPQSHAMIKASEYGLPTLISVPECTKILRDGQNVHLDGDRKCVTFTN